MHWAVHPLTQYALIAVALGACLWLFFGLRRDQALDSRLMKAELAQLRSSLEALRMQLGQLERRLSQVEERAEQPVPAATPLPSMNLTRRGQVLRLARRGDSPDKIAAELGLPVSEVELLLKVLKILDSSEGTATSG